MYMYKTAFFVMLIKPDLKNIVDQFKKPSGGKLLICAVFRD